MWWHLAQSRSRKAQIVWNISFCSIGLLLGSSMLTACKDDPQAQQTQQQTQTQQTPRQDDPLASASSPQTPNTTLEITNKGDASMCLTPTNTPVTPAPEPPRHLSGRLGLWVAQVDPATLNPLRIIGTNTTETFPLASTYKQAVLWAVLREFDAGRVSPTERFDITNANQSLGSYPFDGTNLRTLSTRMIQHSDNTATDILHRRVGLSEVQKITDDLGLCHTRVILPTKDWWILQTGLFKPSNGLNGWTSAQKTQRLDLAQEIDAASQKYRADTVQAKLNDYFEKRYNIDDDLKVHNYSTPEEWGTFLTHFYLKPNLSARADKWRKADMKLGFGQHALYLGEHKIKWFGGKGGNGWRILTYSGYIQTEDDKHVVYAFMQHGSHQTYTIPNTRAAFAWISSAMQQVLTDKSKEPKEESRPKKAPLKPITTNEPDKPVEPVTNEFTPESVIKESRSKADTSHINTSHIKKQPDDNQPKNKVDDEGAQEVEVELPELKNPTTTETTDSADSEKSTETAESTDSTSQTTE